MKTENAARVYLSLCLMAYLGFALAREGRNFAMRVYRTWDARTRCGQAAGGRRGI